MLGYAPTQWQGSGKYLVNIGELDTFEEFIRRLREKMGITGTSYPTRENMRKILRKFSVLGAQADKVFVVSKHDPTRRIQLDPKKTMRENGITYNSTKFEFRICK